MSPAGEFDFIADFLAPMAAGYEGAFGLRDDAARLLASSDIVVSQDTLVEGVHFRSADPWDLVARKALRVNLSDLAAMGAKPHAFLLSLVWPDNVSWENMSLFAAGLSQDVSTFGLPLIGGDTTRGGDRLIVTVTVFGEAAQPLRRNGARPGDDLWLTGTIGDAVLGLVSSQLDSLGEDQRDWLEQRYLLPDPRQLFAHSIADLVSAAIDVSDGLVADAAHIASESHVQLNLRIEQIPLSGASQYWLEHQTDASDAMIKLVTGGDDYELLFAAGQRYREAIAKAGAEFDVKVSRIGDCGDGAGVILSGNDGQPLKIDRAGFTHF